MCSRAFTRGVEDACKIFISSTPRREQRPRILHKSSLTSISSNSKPTMGTQADTIRLNVDRRHGAGNRMKIAQVAPLTEAVPPKLYGGTERVVAYLTDALVELGHEVTLFASGDSFTKAQLAPIWPRALRLDPDVRDRFAPLFMQLETVARRAHEFDVIH